MIDVPVKFNWVMLRHLPQALLFQDSVGLPLDQCSWFYRWKYVEDEAYEGMSYLHQYQDVLSLELGCEESDDKDLIALPIKDFFDEGSHTFPWELLGLPSFKPGISLYLKGANASLPEEIQEVSTLFFMEGIHSDFYRICLPSGEFKWMLLDLENLTYVFVDDLVDFVPSSLLDEWNSVLNENKESDFFIKGYSCRDDVFEVLQNNYFVKENFSSIKILESFLGKGILTYSPLLKNEPPVVRGAALDGQSIITWEEFF